MRAARLIFIVVWSALLASAASAQTSNFALMRAPDAQAPPPGWVVTPALLYQSAWDDNVLLRLNGDEAPGDYINLVNPHIDASYLGRHSHFSASYDANFALYRQLDTLNSYDQHASVSASRAVTPHITLFAQNTFASVPTTELFNLVAVPFIRAGTKVDSLRGGTDASLSKYTTVTATYSFDWVAFEQNTFNPFLFGGHTHGANVGLKHALNPTTSLTANYSFHHSLVGEEAVLIAGANPINHGTFNVQNGDVGFEKLLSPQTRVFGAFGFSRLDIAVVGLSQAGPAWRAGVTQHFKTAYVDASYIRSYVPAYGFGGTTQNEELRAQMMAPLARRLSVQSVVAWRRNEPVAIGALKLKSLWVEGSFGYALQPWVRLEAFYAGDHQVVEAPGGIASRNRIGLQIVTSKPLRVQ
jgi:hypothetical protein